MYNALITDLDGTVVGSGDDGSDLSEDLSKIVQQAESFGKKITCATGRGWLSTKPVVKRLGMTSPCIIEGGSRIIDPITEKTIWERFLNEHDSQMVVEIFKLLSSGRELLKSTSNTNRIPIPDVNSI